jgi:amino acid transporter
MSLRELVFGKPLATSEEAKEQLSVLTGVPVLGLDALASTGYGPEAALTVLLPLGVLGLRYYPFIVLAIVLNLAILYLSYQQVAAAYPNGGGAYVVAHDNLGAKPALCAAVALLLDYLLNVAVAIAAGIGAVVSAIPILQPYTLPLCLATLLTLTFLNLRGVRESGLIFAIPVFVFIGCIGVALGIGLLRAWQTGGNPQAVIPPPPLLSGTMPVSVWLLLAAFANGCTAMTGIEAVSNGIPLFREPRVPHARRTLTVIVGTLGLFLLGLGCLCPAYHIGAMAEQEPGYQTVLSQLLAAVAGHGVFYYIANASVFIVLTYSAQTSFTDFPRVCRLLAEDDFLPSYFANRGRRLVFSDGIVILAVLSGVLLTIFGGVTSRLIPLFAVGAFGAFLFSQSGMVVHWLRRSDRGVRRKLVINAVGAATTAVVLAIIVLAKFTEGAWITVIVVPAAVLLLNQIHRHYTKVAQEVDRPLALQTGKLRPPLVIVPIDSWNRVAEKAMRFGLLLSDEVIAMHISTERDDPEGLRELWQQRVEQPARGAGLAVPRLEIVNSPYRRINQPILEFVDRTRSENPGRLIAVIIPDLVEPHWYEYLLHTLHAAQLRSLLYRKGNDRTVIVNAPWYVRDT